MAHSEACVAVKRNRIVLPGSNHVVAVQGSHRLGLVPPLGGWVLAERGDGKQDRKLTRFRQPNEHGTDRHFIQIMPALAL